jgi:hypothetical protein
MTLKTTGKFKVGGSLAFRGFCTVKRTIVVTPPQPGPILLGGQQPRPVQKERLVEAYNREAVANGWWSPANRAFIPTGTAKNFTKVNRRAVAPGVTPHHLLLVTE